MMARFDPAHVVEGAALVYGIFSKLNASLMEKGGTPEHLIRLSTPEGDDTIERIAELIFNAGGGLLAQRLDSIGFDMSKHSPDRRVSYCLAREGIKTVGDLVSKKESELMWVENFGPKSLALVKERLAQHGLALRPEKPARAPWLEHQPTLT